MIVRRDQHPLVQPAASYHAYSIAYMAIEQTGDTIVGATFCFAENDDNAAEFAQSVALEELPAEEGYSSHISVAQLIPDEQIHILVTLWEQEQAQPTRIETPTRTDRRTQATRPQTAPQPQRPPTRQRYPMEARSCTLDDVPQCRRCRRAAVEFDPRRGWLCEVHRG